MARDVDEESPNVQLHGGGAGVSKYQVSVNGHEETLVVMAAGARHAKMEAIRLYGHIFARMGWPKLKARKMTKAQVQMHEDLPHGA